MSNFPLEKHKILADKRLIVYHILCENLEVFMSLKLKISKQLFISYLLTSLVALITLGGMGIFQLSRITKENRKESVLQTLQTAENLLKSEAEAEISQEGIALMEKIYSTYQSAQQGRLSTSSAQYQAQNALLYNKAFKNSSLMILDNSGKVEAANNQARQIGAIDSLADVIQKKSSSARSEIFKAQISMDGNTKETTVLSRYLPGWKWYMVIIIPDDKTGDFLDPEESKNILKNIRVNQSGYIEVLDLKGNILFHPADEVQKQTLHQKYIEDVLKADVTSVTLNLKDDTNDYQLILEKGLDKKVHGPDEIKTIEYHYLPRYGVVLAVHQYKKDMMLNFNKIRRNMVILIVLLLFLVFSVSLYFSRLLGRNLDSIDMRLGQMASQNEKSDLTKRITVHANNELDSIAIKFNSLMRSFNADMLKVRNAAVNLSETSHVLSDSVINNMKSSMEVITASIQSIQENTLNQTSGVEEVNATLEEMSRSIDSMSENMSRQSAAVEESASAIEEMSRNIDNASATAEKTTNISKNLNQVATEGGEAVKNSMASIKDVSDYSQQILKMLKLITDISKQTNLLAMNASIEAAHAGEAGKGFAIVADEIRRLAENTSKNAKDIGDVVNAIVEKIEESVNLAEKAGMGLDMILAYSNQNVNIMQQLNSALEEQNHSAKEILKSTQDMVSVTEEVQLAMTEQKTGTHEFSEIMRNLRDISVETKDSIQSHIEKLNQMILEVEEVNKISDKNSSLSGELMQLIDHFVLDDSGDAEQDSTSLKLVE